MKITVRLYGGLRRADSPNPLEMDLQTGATIADVIAALGFRAGEVWLATVNDELVEVEHRLAAGDELSLMPPVGGGTFGFDER